MREAPGCRPSRSKDTATGARQLLAPTAEYAGRAREIVRATRHPPRRTRGLPLRRLPPPCGRSAEVTEAEDCRDLLGREPRRTGSGCRPGARETQA